MFRLRIRVAVDHARALRVSRRRAPGRRAWRAIRRGGARRSGGRVPGDPVDAMSAI
ncbi:hypothetical protein [Streptomyces sp. NPDC101166]|uniref:hypothetical protein n=1 Tax=Streptomyces sp. NPDC101166 TaxID=3366120 RepID=UPI0037F78DE1